MPALEQLITWTAYVCLAGATFGCLYTAFACLKALQFGRAAGVAAPSPVPVTVLMPLCGHEPGLYGRLRALCEQDYDAPVQIVCAMHDVKDPSIAVVQALAADLPQANIEWQADSRVHGRNLKLSNLLNVVARAQHDVIVMIDSDILVGRDHLARVVGELQRPGVGAVTCLYYGIAGGGWWSRLSAMNVNLQFLPSVIVGIATRLAQPCFGSTIALTRPMLERIGGLQRFVDQLWDDYAVGQAVRETGMQVAVSSMTAGHVCVERNGREFFDYQLRNGRTIGSIDPAGYAGAVITHPFALSLLALALDPGQPALAVALAAIVSRLALATCMRRRFGLRGDYWLVPVHDIAAFAIYLMSFFGGTVMWRGRRYRFHSDGTLLQPSQ
jgi:ceramide glucosyltransferase